MKINYVSELTGSGKTSTILDNISKCTEKYIIALPNKTLCDEVFDRLTDRGLLDEIQVINTDTRKIPSRYLGETIMNFKKTRIIITTHVSLLRGVRDAVLHKTKDWNLIIDEEMPFYVHHEFNVSELSKSIIEKTIDVTEYDEVCYSLTPKDQLLWNDILIGRCDDTFLQHPAFVELIKYASLDTYTTLIPKDQYHEFLNGVGCIKDGKFTKFNVISILNDEFFSSFKSMTVLCSFFEKTVSFKLLEWLDMNLIRQRPQKNPLVYHPNSTLVTINYYTKSNWSSLLKNRPVQHIDPNMTLEAFVRDHILKSINNKPFIYSTNISLRDNFGSGKLVTSTHGVNKYIDHTTMVYMPSLNATASLVNTLSYFGITRRYIDFSRNVIGAYQFISRGAVRKRNNKEPIQLYLMDRRAALFIKELFPNAEMVYHDAESYLNKEGKSKNSVPNNVRSFVSRVRKRMKDGVSVRDKTLTKYNKLLKEYYS